MLKLKLPYFSHLMWRADSLEKTLMLGKIEIKRRRGWQSTRWLDGITENKHMARCSVWFLQGIFLNQGLKQGAVWAGFCNLQTSPEVPVLRPGVPACACSFQNPSARSVPVETSQGIAQVAAPPVLPEHPPLKTELLQAGVWKAPEGSGQASPSHLAVSLSSGDRVCCGPTVSPKSAGWNLHLPAWLCLEAGL